MIRKSEEIAGKILYSSICSLPLLCHTLNWVWVWFIAKGSLNVTEKLLFSSSTLIPFFQKQVTLYIAKTLATRTLAQRKSLILYWQLVCPCFSENIISHKHVLWYYMRCASVCWSFYEQNGFIFIQKHGTVGSASDSLSVSLWFELHQRLLLFP